MISEYTISKVKEVSKIEDVIGQFITLKRNGSGWVCLCPYHEEKTPSFTIKSSENFYKCFSCGKGGDSIDFLMEYKKFTYQQSIEYLCNKYKILMESADEPKKYTKPVFKNNTKLSDKLIKWFADNRKISQTTLEKLKITEAKVYVPQAKQERNCIQFNYFRDGELVNIKSRDGQKNFKLESGSELILYNIDSLKNAKECFWTEGEPDTAALVEAGIMRDGTGVVSVPNGASKGTNNLKYLDNSIEQLEHIEWHYLGFDNDPNGRKLREDIAERLGKDKCKYIEWKDKKDANEVLINYGIQGVIDCTSEKKEFPLIGVFPTSTYTEELKDLYHNGLDMGVGIGINEFDKQLKFSKGYLTVITGISSHGKALCINTDIPTADGWKKMSDVNVFDKLYDENGKLCYVTNVTDVMYDRPCYKVKFNDGTEIIADEEHQWLTDTWKSKRSAANRRRNDIKQLKGVKNNGTDQSHKRTYPSVKTTLEISKTIFHKDRINHFIPLSKPIENKEAVLLIPPYTLGAWLGDGHSSGGGFTSNDPEIIANIVKDGFEVNKRNSKYEKNYAYGILKLKYKLRKLSVLDNKHIPMQYLRASYKQRLALLQGLMDTDGHINKIDKRCEFCNINKEMSYQVFELITSLGIRATIIESDAMLYGRFISKKYRVQFTTKTNVFKLKRKLKILPKERTVTKSDRCIISCEKIESVPVKCIEVDSPSHLFLCTKSFIATHNSSFVDQMCCLMALNQGWKFAYYSPENRPTKLHLSNIIRKLVGKNWFGDKKLTEQEMNYAINWMEGKFYFIKPDKDFTLKSVLDHAKQLKLKYGIDGIIFDSWNKFEHKLGKAAETQYISEQLDMLLNFLESNNLHGFLVAHPTKMEKDKKNPLNYVVPNLYSIAGSAAFFSKADNGICVYRDYVTGRTKVFVQKVRFSHLGEIGFTEWQYAKDSGRFDIVHAGDIINKDATNWITRSQSQTTIEPPPYDGGIIINEEEPPF